MLDLTNWMMVFLRAGAMLSIFPVFSSPTMPATLRIALAALIAYLIGPALPAFSDLPQTLGGLVGLMSIEVGVGLLLGFASRMIFYAIELAGAVIGAQMALVLPANVDPMTAHQSAAPAAILNYLGAVLWLTLDLHHWLLAGFQRTYHFLPIGGAGLSEPLLTDFIARTGHVFVIATQMAAPIIAVTFIITLVFAVLGRAVTQMNVFTESFSFRVLGGLIVFGLTLQLIGQHIANYLKRLPEDVLQVARFLGA